jgi:hypothetical protein
VSSLWRVTRAGQGMQLPARPMRVFGVLLIVGEHECAVTF